MSITKRIVHLRVYRGTEINYDATGKVKNENQQVTLKYGDVSWRNYLKLLHANGICNVEVEDVLAFKDGNYVSVEKSEIEAEVKNAFNPKVEAELTPEQKRIAELEAKIEALANQSTKDTGNPDPKPPKKEDETVSPKLPKGKKLEDLTLPQLRKSFPNVADLGIDNVEDFIIKVRELYPEL